MVSQSAEHPAKPINLSHRKHLPPEHPTPFYLCRAHFSRFLYITLFQIKFLQSVVQHLHVRCLKTVLHRIFLYVIIHNISQPLTCLCHNIIFRRHQITFKRKWQILPGTLFPSRILLFLLNFVLILFFSSL